ncbi:hypothetical protein [Sutcliffiella cohnii]|uniref:SRPBCC family protein n=1 Tax=Sutcliffiella cohnii TaxID=33932 RepID=UPI002E231DFC|nr:hypothetical protein [Sutcliffiella cohnii]
MMRFRGVFTNQTELAVPIDAVWDFFQTTENLARITSYPKVNIQGSSVVEEGKTMRLQLHFGIWITSWDSYISHWKEKEGFEDTIVKPPFPFSTWKHRHQFIAKSEDETMMMDILEFQSQLPPWLIKAGLYLMFKDRERAIKKYLNNKS